jgi:protocatechuate 3,4-dioxygenase beta subunit
MHEPRNRRSAAAWTEALTRRESLRLAGGAALLAVVAPPLAACAASLPASCIVPPEQTEGPYFIDDRLNRSDIRTDPRDGSVRSGVPLALSILVSKTSGGSCAPLAGATVDLWHCDAEGVYSGVRDPGFETLGRKFLRGYQVTDADGAARFTTIYPGWYPGRAVHLHFKVRSGRSELTSQLYFDDALSDRIFTRAPYARSGERLRNEDDGIFSDDGEQLMLQVEPSERGYAASFQLALEI